MVFFEIVSMMFSVLFYAILSTMVLMGLLFVLLSILDKRHVGTIPFFITGLFLAIVLVVQFTLMIGAMRVKAVVSDLKETATAYSNTLQNGATTLCDGLQEGIQLNEIEQIPEISEGYKMIEKYGNILHLSVEDLKISADAGENILDNVFQGLDDRLTSYLWHRVWWIIAMVILSCVIVLVLPGKKTSFSSSRHSCDDYSCGSSSDDVGDWGF